MKTNNIILNDLLTTEELKLVNMIGANSAVNLALIKILPTAYIDLNTLDFNHIAETGILKTLSAAKVFEILDSRFLGLMQRTWKPD